MRSGKRERWRRRAVSWPLVVLATPLALLVSPLLFVLAAIIDLAIGPRRRRALRLSGMAITYLILELVGLLAALALWVATGFGVALRRPWSQRVHHRVQRWWATSLWRAVQYWGGIHLDVTGVGDVDDEPVIVAARHVSIADALIPSILLLSRSERHARHVLADGLAWDPCLDVYGHRLPNHFVRRQAWSRGVDIAALEALAEGAAEDHLVIFPEGTLASPDRIDRAAARLRRSDPLRAQRLALHHLLPPRPGGILTLLDHAPRRDVVFVAHTGLEDFRSWRGIIRNLPARRPLTVATWRWPVSAIPEGAEERMAQIDQWWQRLDDWITQSTATQHHDRTTPAP